MSHSYKIEFTLTTQEPVDWDKGYYVIAQAVLAAFAPETRVDGLAVSDTFDRGASVSSKKETQ